LATLAAVLLGLVTGAAVYGLMSFASRDDRSDHLSRLYDRTGAIFRAAIDPRFQSKAAEIDRVVSRLVVIDAIKGGALFDGSGHLQDVFGETPETVYEAIERSSSAILPSRDPRRVEFYYPPAATGTHFHIIARVSVTEAGSLEVERADRRIWIALMTGMSVGLAGGFVVFTIVVRPLRRIAFVVDRIASNPATADGAGSLDVGYAEIRNLAVALDIFRDMLSDVWRTKVAVADIILERSPFGVVQIAADGSPTFANPAAIDLFEREIVRGAVTVPPSVRDVSTGTISPIKDHLVRHRGAVRLVEVIGARSARFAMLGSLTVGTDSRTPTIVAMFCDATAVQVSRMDAETRFASGAALLKTARRRELELRLTLESCIMLMAGPDTAAEEHLDALPFAAEWMAAAKEAGIAAEGLVLSAEGPIVAGAPDDLKAAIRLGLLLAYARCGAAPADIVVDAKGIDFETAGVTIRAQPSPASAGRHEAVVADWPLVFAAVRTAIRRVGGQLTEFNAAEDGVVLRFLLRGASERMATMKAR
jgi:PAS domain-containing protein